MADELAKIDGNQALVDPKTLKPRGFENFDQEDLILPRIAIAQALSKPVVDGDMRQGALYNTLTQQQYVDVDGKPYLQFIVLMFNKSRRLWDKDKKDNSLCMSTDGKKSVSGKICQTQCPFTRGEVAKEIGTNPNLTAFDWSEDNKGNRLAPVCTLYNNYLSLVAPFDKANIPASISMGRTSAKVSKQFNSFIMATGEDIFGRVYALMTEKKENQKGTFFVYKIKPVGKPSMDEYRKAEAMAVRIASTSYTIHDEGDIDESQAEDPIPF